MFRKIPCCGSSCCCADSSRNNKKPKSNVVGSDSVIDKTRHQLYASTASINGGVTQVHHHQISGSPTTVNNNGSSNLQNNVIHHNNNPQHIQHVIQNQTVQLMEQSLAPHSHSSSSGGSSSTTSSTGTSSGGSTALDNSQQQLTSSTPNKVINTISNEHPSFPIQTQFSQVRNLNSNTQGHVFHRSSENILLTPQTLNHNIQTQCNSGYPNPQNGIPTPSTPFTNGYLANPQPVHHMSSLSQPASIRATPVNNQFELYPRSSQVTSPYLNRHSTTPTPALFTANGQIYTQSPPPYDGNPQTNETSHLTPIPLQQIARTNSFTQATQNQPIQLNNVSSGPVSLGASAPVSLPLSSLPTSPSMINATTVYYNPIHGNSQPNDATASIIFAARNGLNRKRVFSSPNNNSNKEVQKTTNGLYTQNPSSVYHHRSGSCSSILSNSNNTPSTNMNINGNPQIRGGQFTNNQTDIILRNQVQNEVLYNHIHNQQQNQQPSQFRRPKSHSPCTMQQIPHPSSPIQPNTSLISTSNVRTSTDPSVDHCYDRIHNRQLSSSSAGFYFLFLFLMIDHNLPVMVANG